MPPDPLLDHLEKTFAEAYRKEIDQEENVWRSLPFFAATLALQLAAIGQVREWLRDLDGALFLLAASLLGLAALATFAAVLFLALSVWPAEFQYVAREPAFRDYAQRVRSGVAESEGEEAAGDRALATVKAALAEQYAVAADNNRRINQRRARWRTRAGLAILASVLCVLVLVALGVVSNMHGDARHHQAGGRAASPASQPVAARPPQPQPGPAAADGGGPQGLVGRPRDGAPGGGAGPRGEDASGLTAPPPGPR